MSTDLAIGSIQPIVVFAHALNDNIHHEYEIIE